MYQLIHILQLLVLSVIIAYSNVEAIPQGGAPPVECIQRGKQQTKPILEYIYRYPVAAAGRVGTDKTNTCNKYRHIAHELAADSFGTQWVPEDRV